MRIKSRSSSSLNMSDPDDDYHADDDDHADDDEGGHKDENQKPIIFIPENSIW